MSLTPQELQSGFRIGEYLVEPRQNRIVRGESEVRLEPRVMDVLVCLAEHAGEVVSRDTLNATVWRDVVVTDQAVTNCISELRDHLGDDRSTNRVIETIPKRGYRLVAPVNAGPDAGTASPMVPPQTFPRWPWPLVGTRAGGGCRGRVVAHARCDSHAHQRGRREALRTRPTTSRSTISRSRCRMRSRRC